MNVNEAYKTWADIYDTNINKTRDLEAISLRETLAFIKFDKCLEIGCGTGKNTECLMSFANNIIAVDLTPEMLFKAKEKIKSKKVTFVQADINDDWTFVSHKVDLIVFSLVLEHIENLDSIFKKASETINSGGYIYIGELHPFKQYTGTKARFETKQGTQTVTCFNHNISDFTQLAIKYGFIIIDINEYFDNNDRSSMPRILTLMLKKTK
jgi:predicted TPR repeat methyltransferase